MEQTFKLLKITRVDGSIDYVPNNRMNLKLHNDYKSALSKEKQERYKFEPVELSIEEAAAIGIQEAHAILHPTKKKSTQAGVEYDGTVVSSTSRKQPIDASEIECDGKT